MIAVAILGLFSVLDSNVNGVWPVCSEPVRGHLSRVRMYRKCLKIKDGTSKSDVRVLLGEPDDVTTDTALPPHQLWCYGTNGHGTFATLGLIAFDGDLAWMPDKATCFPPPDGMFEEGTLRSLMRQVDWSYYSENPPDLGDPLAIIRALLALRPLVKERALAVIREVDRVQDVWARKEPLLHVLIALFGGSGARNLGKMANLYFESYRKDVVFVHGIPLVYYRSGGLPDSASRPLELLESAGCLPEYAQVPTTDLGTVIDDFASHLPKGGINAREVRRQAIRQLLLLVRTVAQPDRRIFSEGHNPFQSEWDASEAFLRGLKARGLRWNVKDARYELPGHRPLDPIGFTSY